MGNRNQDAPLRIAMLGAFPPQCQGIQEYCRAIAEALSERCAVRAIGFKRMYPACLFPGVKAAMDPEKPPMRGPMLDTEHRLTWYNPLTWLRAGLFAPADVFHLQWWSLPLFPVAFTLYVCMRLRGKPFVVTIHNVLPHEGGGMLARAGRFFCRRADAVLVHGTAMRDLLIARYGVPAEQVHDVAMPAQAGPVALPPRDEARRALGLADDANVVLCFGIIRPYKGIDVLLRAFARYAAGDAAARLVIAGCPWCDWEPYQAIIEEEELGGRVDCMLEYVNDVTVARLFAAADLAVLPYTHFDAQSAVGAQMAAHGVPLVVSDVGALPDWVDGDASWIALADDVPAWTAALEAFFADTAGRRAEYLAIAERVQARCSPEAVAAAHEAVYRALTSNTS